MFNGLICKDNKMPAMPEIGCDTLIQKLFEKLSESIQIATLFFKVQFQLKYNSIMMLQSF